jgi:DNA-3-methyladenine glycosylase II
MIGMPHLFESLVWSIIGQQINLNFAYSLKEKLVHNFGQKLIHNNEAFYALPTPERLASLNIEDFQPFQFSRSKAQYIINVSREFAEGNLSQKALKKLSFEEVKENLIQRDYEDMNRIESPLRKAKDAIILDNSNLTQPQQLEFALNLIDQILS